MEQKAIDRSGTIGSETCVSCLPNLNARLAVTKPSGHVLTLNVEIASNDKTETSCTKLSDEIIGPLIGNGPVLGVPVETHNNELTQTVIFKLHRHAPIATNDSTRAGTPDVMRPKKTHTTRGASPIAGVESGS